MNELSCRRVDALAHATALGSHSDLSSSVARHLATCPQDHAETRELLAAVSVLAGAVLPVEPGPQLRSRLMATIAHTPQGATIQGQRGDAGVPPARRARPGWRDWLRPGLTRGITATAAAAVVVLAVVAFQLQSQLAARDATLQAVARTLSRGEQVLSVMGSAGSGYLVRSSDDRATLLLAGLDAPPPGHLYEMWLIDADGAVLPAGTFVPGDTDVSVVDVAGGVANAATFAVTLEQHRVDQPTSDPVLVADLAQ
ncbi:MAG: anti-sigma factor [Chloroflexota bacterium]